jgi:CubicO group peptidase (beta-lactamase class C family)
LVVVACSRAGPPSPQRSTTAAGQATAPTGTDARFEDLSLVLEPLRRKHNLPALGAAVVTPDGVKSLGVVGVRKYGDHTPASVDDAFHLGSDTKALTAVVIAKLVEQGKLSWTATVHDLLADIKDQNPAYASVTLEQLLAHRSGLAHDPKSVSIDEQGGFTGSMRERREMYAQIALRESPAKPPGTAFLYSNAGYVIAALMAERASGRAWEDLLGDTLFTPLAMNRVGFGTPKTPDPVGGLWPHTFQNGIPVPIEPGPSSDNPIFQMPAGGVRVSMEGWSRFIVDVLRGFEGTGSVLSRQSYEHLHAPPFGGTYAYGWEVVKRSWADGTAYMHGGSNTLNYALVWLAPKRRFGVLVATNAGTDAAFRACDDVVGALIERQ